MEISLFTVHFCLSKYSFSLDNLRTHLISPAHDEHAHFKMLSTINPVLRNTRSHMSLTITKSDQKYLYLGYTNRNLGQLLNRL